MGIDEYLQSRDVSPSDIPPFILIHTVLSAALVGSTWWWCYWGSGRTTQVQCRLFEHEQIPKSMLLNGLVSAPVISDGIKRRAVRALLAVERASRDSGPVRYLERRAPSLDATRVCVSYAEAKLGRLFFKPITVPGRIWLSWRGARMWKGMKGGEETSRSGAGDAGVPASFAGCANAVKIGAKRLRLDLDGIDPKSQAIFSRECKDFTPKSKTLRFQPCSSCRGAGQIIAPSKICL